MTDEPSWLSWGRKLQAIAHGKRVTVHTLLKRPARYHVVYGLHN